MDIVSPARRSAMMSRVRGKGTKPELIVRSMAHRLGYRFRLHVKGLPGSPDLVFPRSKLALFVHGCFWHRHGGCAYAYNPKSNVPAPHEHVPRLSAAMFSNRRQSRPQAAGRPSLRLSNINSPIGIHLYRKIDLDTRQTARFFPSPGTSSAEAEPATGHQKTLGAVYIEALACIPSSRTCRNHAIRFSSHRVPPGSRLFARNGRG